MKTGRTTNMLDSGIHSEAGLEANLAYDVAAAHGHESLVVFAHFL
jgi:hypothetical protein